jgi:hypothetical protein
LLILTTGYEPNSLILYYIPIIISENFKKYSGIPKLIKTNYPIWKKVVLIIIMKDNCSSILNEDEEIPEELDLQAVEAIRPQKVEDKWKFIKFIFQLQLYYIRLAGVPCIINDTLALEIESYVKNTINLIEI